MSKRTTANLMLLVAAMIWGSAFVAQSVGMDYVEPFTFQAVRCFLGSLVLLPVIALRDRGGNPQKPITAAQKKYLLTSGLFCGIFLFIACSLQQIGLVYTAPGKSGFITSLYIVLVPVFGIFLGRKVNPTVWISVALAFTGLYLLCGGGAFSLGIGELTTLGSAIVFTIHILYIAHVSPNLDGVRLSCLQFCISGFLSLIAMFLFDAPTVSGILQCWLPIAYAGIMSSGVAFTLQIIAQSRTDPTVASILMSLESVFSVIFGWIILGDMLRSTELFGCLLVFSGVILAQLPEKHHKAKFH